MLTSGMATSSPTAAVQKPTDDYYTSQYVPTALLERWYALKHAASGEDANGLNNNNIINAQFLRGENSLFFGRTEYQEGGSYGEEGHRTPQDDFKEEEVSSCGSAYTRHHRFDDASTAYQHISDPYDRPREIMRQENFIKESKRIGKPFVVGSGELGKPTRLLLGDCVCDLYRRIGSDWREAEPVVVSTAEDLIAVYFSLKLLRKRQAAVVLNYMNRGLKCNDVILKHGLSKVPEGWNVATGDGHLMFTFRPPWVKKRRFLPNSLL